MDRIGTSNMGPPPDRRKRSDLRWGEPRPARFPARLSGARLIVSGGFDKGSGIACLDRRLRGHFRRPVWRHTGRPRHFTEPHPQERRPHEALAEYRISDVPGMSLIRQLFDKRPSHWANHARSQ